MNDRYNSVPTQGGINSMDRERQSALDTITSAFALGKISLEEYEVRAEKIQKALALGDIVEQTIDLPPQELPREPERGSRAAVSARGERGSATRPGAASLRRQAPLPAEDLFIEERNGTPEFSLCVMGDRKLAGDWLNSDQATSFTLMGSTTLDLSNTALPPGRLKIDAIAIMGEIRILVPRGLPVKMSAFPFMGEANIHSSVEQRIDRHMPWVDISGLALMGSITVKAV
ncbi:MAG: LiaF domain-containing protein [Spirochaetales bacterium]